MGHNLDLIQMLGAPEKMECNYCGAVSKTYFEEYDIDCGEPNPKPGVWCLTHWCNACEKDTEWKCNIAFNHDESIKLNWERFVIKAGSEDAKDIKVFYKDKEMKGVTVFEVIPRLWYGEK
jgi:hypothetical protein